MTTSTKYSLKVLTTGFMVLVFFSIPMFWARYFCALGLRAGLPNEAKGVDISPSGLLPEAVESDPNAHRQSMVSGHMDDEALLNTLGLTDYVFSKLPGGRRSDVLYYGQDKVWMYFDRSTGQLVFRDACSEQRDGGTVSRLTMPHFAGPEGVSQSSDEDLGRFTDPIVARYRGQRLIVYDAKLRRFFAIERETMTVQAGPELDAAVSHEPVRIGSLWEHEGVHLNFQPTMRRVPRKNQEDSRRQYDWHFNGYLSSGGARGLPVVNASGRIDLLDVGTLELTVGRAHLPVPKTLYGEGLAEPGRLLHYEVDPICIGTERTPRGIDWEYVGMVVGSMSRQGTSMALAVFDKDGKRSRAGHSKAVPYHQKASAIQTMLNEAALEGTARVTPSPSRTIGSAQAVLSEVRGGPMLSTVQYLAENLHPPVLTMASFFLANCIEAGASHRTVFLMPNSFAAQHRDMVGHDIFTEFFRAMLVVMLPAILLAVFLAWRVVRDAKIVGLSSNARLLWVLGTLGFGLPAYITHRLTRPKAALVTCVNCGLPRRPDMDRCHCCNGPWCVPELNPPAWRVLDGGRQDLDEPTAKPEESPAT